MSAEQPTIIYTLTDEAPLLATYAFLPIIRTFADAAGIDVKTSDISVAARIGYLGKGGFTISLDTTGRREKNHAAPPSFY